MQMGHTGATLAMAAPTTTMMAGFAGATPTASMPYGGMPTMLAPTAFDVGAATLVSATRPLSTTAISHGGPPTMPASFAPTALYPRL